MSKLCEIGYIKELMAKHGFGFSKALGQNFLCAPHVPVAIAEASGANKDTCVLEVGPGIGTLSYELCKVAKQVVAVELDKRLPDILADTMGEFNNFTVVQGDVLKTDIPALVKDKFGNQPVIACANLPYYITTPALSTLIDANCFEQITVMVQKEVAKRICAAPDTSDYGSFTVYVNYFALPSIALNVPAGCFIPAPKVDSAVVTLVMRKEPAVKVISQDMFFRVVKAAFAQRRKTLVNCLNAAFPQHDKAFFAQMLVDMGISPTARGETLGIIQFGGIADRLCEEKQ